MYNILMYIFFGYVQSFTGATRLQILTSWGPTGADTKQKVCTYKLASEIHVLSANRGRHGGSRGWNITLKKCNKIFTFCQHQFIELWDGNCDTAPEQILFWLTIWKWTNESVTKYGIFSSAAAGWLALFHRDFSSGISFGVECGSRASKVMCVKKL